MQDESPTSQGIVSHLGSVGDPLLLVLSRRRLQGRGKALRERVAVLPGHNQMKGYAELGEGQRSVPVHIAQLP